MSNDKKYGLSRRKALLGLGTIGAAGAGAGLGTSALFSDEESFTNNRLVAGELDLIIDYGTSVDDPTNASSTDVIDGGQANSGTIDGDVSTEYVLNDVKPGDGGFLAFCPKVVDNPAWLWAGSSGLTDFENGYTEPELSADPDADSSTALGDDDPGEGEGELSENIQVTVEYCEYVGPDDGDRGDPDNYDTIRELNNPDDYTLADLILDLQAGFLLDGDDTTSGTQAYPASEDSDTQEGPCICIKWDIPADVGNEIQSDSVKFDIQFAAEQERNNPDPDSPFTPNGFSPIAFNTDNAGMDLQLIQETSSGGEIQIHGDSGGVEQQGAFGGGGAPLDTDITVTAELDPSGGTATFSADDGTNAPSVTDNDVTDGQANGSGTGNAEFPGGVPSNVDVSVGAKTGSSNFTAIVEDVSINGTAVPNELSASDEREWAAYTNADTSGGLTVEFTARFEGTPAGGGADIIDVHFGDINA